MATALADEGNGSAIPGEILAGEDGDATGRAVNTETVGAYNADTPSSNLGQVFLQLSPFFIFLLKAGGEYLDCFRSTGQTFFNNFENGGGRDSDSSKVDGFWNVTNSGVCFESADLALLWVYRINLASVAEG